MAERQTTEIVPEIVPDPDEQTEYDERPPEHRVLWEEENVSSPSPVWTPTGPRKTLRFPRPQLAGPWGPISSPSSPEPSVDPARERPYSTALVHVQPLERPMTSTIGGPVAPHLLRARCKLDPRLVMLADPDSARGAAFRLLCDNLVAKGLPHVLAVSSAARHDGKTTCAVNLALALAERPGATVLLVDGNFSEPALADIFGIDEHTPTSPYLGFPWLPPFKLAELTPCLHVAALVPRRNESSARIEMHGFDVLVDRLSRAGYNRVVIDGSTLDGSPAGGRLVGVADGVLLAVRSGRTTTRALRRALERITRGKVLGAALMDADPESP